MDEVRIELARGDVVVHLAGELDRAGVEPVRAVVAALPPGRALVLDLAAVTFADLSGLRLLLDLRDRAVRTGTRFVVRHPPRPVRRLLEVTDTGGRLGVDLPAA